MIELLVTLAILAILASVVVPTAKVTHQSDKERELRHALREIRSAIDAYKLAADQGRILKEPGSPGYPARLEQLVEGMEDLSDPKRRKLYFLRRIPRDPMSDDEAIDPAISWGKRSFESEASDPREGENVYDVFSRSREAGFNQQPYRLW